jgi:hypothetical protein
MPSAGILAKRIYFECSCIDAALKKSPCSVSLF